jgi:hypothetical protein
LKQAGWKVLRFWEHYIFENLDEVVQKVVNSVSATIDVSEIDWRVIAVEILDDAGSLERRRLVSMNDPSQQCSVIRPRITSKWKKPKSAMEQPR